MALQKFDELNNVESAFREYYSVMKLPQIELDRRFEIAMDYYEIIMYIYALIEQQIEFDFVDSSFINAELKKKLYEMLDKYDFLDDAYALQMINSFSDDLTESLIEKAEEDKEFDEEDAVFIAEDQGNYVGNYIQYKEASKKYKYKTWKTKEDNKVRDSHLDLNDVTLPVEELFVVGFTQMRFPKDSFYSSDYKEIARCRCWLEFSN